MQTNTLYIRTMSAVGFRRTQWAKVVLASYKPGTSDSAGKPVYEVTFIDGAIDYWPIYDGDAHYEFTSTPYGDAID